MTVNNNSWSGIAAVIVDLDGTILDTAPDLIAATNAVLREVGRPALPAERIVSFVGKGAEVLIHRALTDDLDGRAAAADHDRAMTAFKRHYSRENGRAARPFPGVVDGLSAFRDAGLRLACVTNKPAMFTEPLLAATRLAPFFELVVSGDTLPAKKPDPMPLVHVADRFGVEPARVVAIGDSLNDAAAARAAGMRVLAVPYGYNEGQDVRSLDVDGIVASLLEAASLLGLTPGDPGARRA